MNPTDSSETKKPTPVIPGPTRLLVERTNLAFAAGAVGASFAFASPRFAVSVLLGAAVETLNLRALWRSSELALGLGDPGSTSWLAMLGFGARFAMVGLVLWLALSSGANAIGLLIGLSLIIPAVVLAAWRHRPPVVEGLPALEEDDPEWDMWNPWTARERDPEEDED